MNPRKEYIIAAAYKLMPEYVTEPRIQKHPSIQEIAGKNDDIYSIATGRCHADILHRYRGKIDINSDGFYTSYGRYVNRMEAYRIALAAEQIDPQSTIHYGPNAALFSEDIFFQD